MHKKSARPPTPILAETTILDQLTVRLIRPDEQVNFDALIVEHHYLHRADLVGEQLRYVAEYQGQWLALGTWSAAALHLKARDQHLGWTIEQRRQRLSLIANNSRLVVLPDYHYPNLMSRFMKLMLARLAEDWQAVWGHPVVFVETFVDPHHYQGTTYKVSGWTPLGTTAGWQRSAVDFYEKHEDPKHLWVRELVKHAALKLRAPQLSPAWALAETPASPRCTAPVPEIRSLMEHLRSRVPEFRRAQALAYPVAGLLALIAMAVFSRVVPGPQELAHYAATLSQGQLRALRFRLHPRTHRVRAPQKTTFTRLLAQVDAAVVERVLQCWQEQVLGPQPDSLVIVDGKAIRHAHVDIVNAVNGQGRWLGSTLIPEDTNEIPVARQQIAKLDVAGKLVIADAIHTQVETARQILLEGGGDYLFTVKANQKELYRNLETLLTKQRFSPSTHAADPCLHPRTQLQPAGDPGLGLPGNHPGPSGLSRGPDHRAPPTAYPAQGQENHRNPLFDQQPDLSPTGCQRLPQV